MSASGLVVAGVVGAGVGQAARVFVRELRQPDLGLGPQLVRVGRDLLRAAGLIVAVVAAYWLTILAGLVGIVFLIGSLVCINGEPLNGGGRANGALALVLLVAAVASLYTCVVQLERFHRRARAAIEADIALGIPLLGAGRLLVASSAVAVAGAYVVVAQGLA